MNNTFYMKFFCSYQWKSILQVKPHLITKCADCSCTGTISFLNTAIYNILMKIEVLLHNNSLFTKDPRGKLYIDSMIAKYQQQGYESLKTNEEKLCILFTS